MSNVSSREIISALTELEISLGLRSTLYRVGTLGNLNAKEVETHFTRIFRSRKYKYNFIIGDMNLDSINWLYNSASNAVHSSFINLFNELGLTQFISKPTHKSSIHNSSTTQNLKKCLQKARALFEIF